MNEMLEQVLKFIEDEINMVSDIKPRCPEEIDDDDFFDGEDIFIDGKNEGRLIALNKVRSFIKELS